MNERIRELMEQAMELVDPYALEGEFGPRRLNAEKFAELIVDECVEVCAGIASVRAGYNDADGRDTAYSCGDMIREHFGVME